jgi:hypothetical protein
MSFQQFGLGALSYYQSLIQFLEDKAKFSKTKPPVYGSGPKSKDTAYNRHYQCVSKT